MRIRTLGLASAAALAVLIGLGAAAPAFADTRDDLIAADESLTDYVNSFLDVVNDSSTSVEDVADAAQTFISDAQDSEAQFTQVADKESDATVKGYAQDFASDTDDMITGAGEMSDAITAGDEDQYTDAVDDFNDAIDAYKSSADAYNQYIEDNPLASGDPLYALWLVLLIVAVALLIATILFAVLLRNHHGALPPKPSRNGVVRQTTLRGLRRNLVIYAAIFVVGAAIPFVQYWIQAHNSDGDGTYFIFWYPLLAGVLVIVFAIQYVITALKVRSNGSAPLLGDPAYGQSFGPVPGLPGGPVGPAVPYQAPGTAVPPPYAAPGAAPQAPFTPPTAPPPYTPAPTAPASAPVPPPVAPTPPAAAPGAEPGQGTPPQS